MGMENTMALSVTYKRTARCRNVLTRDLPAGWNLADGQHYAKGMSESKPGVEVTLWAGEKISVIFKDGKIV
jgi:hypothetical protein